MDHYEVSDVSFDVSRGRTSNVMVNRGNLSGLMWNQIVFYLNRTFDPRNAILGSNYWYLEIESYDDLVQDVAGVIVETKSPGVLQTLYQLDE